jgi:hypothetical protein
MPIRILSEADIFLRFRKKVKTQILYLLGGRGVVAAGFELTLAVGSIPAQENRIRHRTYKCTSTVHTYGTEPKYLSYPAYLSNVSDNLLSSVADPSLATVYKVNMNITYQENKIGYGTYLP